MTRLAAPSAPGELSTCSTDVWLENLVAQATVEMVIEGGPTMNLGTADSSGQTFPIPKGVLSPLARVHWRQELGAESSDPSLDFCEVQDSQGPLPPPVVAAPVL